MLSFLWTIALFTPAEAPAELPKELQAFQGSWRLVGGEEVGHKIGAEDAKKEEMVFTFRGNSLVVREKNRIKEQATIVVHGDKDKGTIDFTHKSGKYKDQTCHAIYKCEGDKLTICIASKMREDRAEDRPTVFSTDKKQEKAADRPGKLLFILEREKEKK